MTNPSLFRTILQNADAHVSHLHYYQINWSFQTQEAHPDTIDFLQRPSQSVGGGQRHASQITHRVLQETEIVEKEQQSNFRTRAVLA